ncbi:MAG: methyltransferase domain-containing protein [candidate division FCPU426 bacterium]
MIPPTDPDLAAAWDDVHRYSPAPRHRRRLLGRLLSPLPFDSLLDVGCGQPYLLEEWRRRGKRVAGCDVSPQVIEENRRRLPDAQFAVVDINRAAFPGRQRFDLVVASEVLEHLDDWRAGLENCCAMSQRFIVVTVPAGPRYAIDKMVGHRRHFAGPELAEALGRLGFRIVRMRRWGFPLHTLYKWLINSIAPERMYRSFGASRYGWGQKAASQLLYGLFFINDWFPWGQQLLLLAERK